MKKKEYESPEFDLVVLRFEKMMAQVTDSYGENSGFWIDDPEDPMYVPNIE